MKELSERVGMSRSVFALRFKETVGSTPIEYLTRWRMFRASQRIETSSDSISEIASSLGYESDEAFRGVMGCSRASTAHALGMREARPGRWRRSSGRHGVVRLPVPT